MEINIRKARLKDYEWIKDLHQELSDLHIQWAPWNFEYINPSYNTEFFKEKLEDADTLFYIAEEKNQIIAYCIFQIKHSEDIPILKKRSWLFIKDIVVAQSHKWRWIWTLLLEKWEEIAKELNIWSIELSVWSFNQDAIEFYKGKWFDQYTIKMHKILK